MNSNSMLIHIRQKITGNSKCVYSRTHGTYSWSFFAYSYQGVPKERRRGREEKRLSKRVFLESPFLLCSLKVFRTFQVF